MIRTTYEEISTDIHLNRIYWNVQIRFYIVCRREHLRLQKGSDYIGSIKSALKSRSNFEYFEKQPI